MRLIRFLSLGKALRESKDRPGVYKMESSSIPRFEPVQSTLPLDGGPAPSMPVSGSHFGNGAGPSLSRPGTGAGNAWKTMLRSLLGGDSARRRAAVQGQIELNLERVTPVRNDLSDADLEIVRRDSRPEKRKPDVAFDGRQASGWMRLTQRLFRTNKDPFATQASTNSSAYCAKQTRELIART